MSGSPLFPIFSEFSIARYEACSSAEIRAVRDRFCVPFLRSLIEAHREIKARDKRIADLEKRLATVRDAAGGGVMASNTIGGVYEDVDEHYLMLELMPHALRMAIYNGQRDYALRPIFRTLQDSGLSAALDAVASRDHKFGWQDRKVNEALARGEGL